MSIAHDQSWRPGGVLHALWQHRAAMFVSLAAVILVVVGFAYYVVMPRAHRRSLAEVQSAIAENDFARANTLLRTCLQEWPDDAQFHFLMAQVCRRQPNEDFIGAAIELQKAAAHWPELEIQRENLLLDFQSTGQADQAEAMLQQLVDQHPPDERILYEGLVRGCLRSGRIWAAHRWLSRWIERYPDDWRAYRWRGGLLEAMGEEQHLAAADYGRVLELRPEDDAVRLHLALALVAYGYDFEAALGHFTAYRQRHPEDVDATVGIARCYRELSRPGDAMSLLENVLKSNPLHPTALLTQALVASDLEQDERAWSLLERLEPLMLRRNNSASFAAVQRGELLPLQALSGRQAATVYHQAARVLHRLGRDQAAREYESKLDLILKETQSRAAEKQ